MNLRKYMNVARYALYDAGNSNYDTLFIALAFPIFLEEVVVSDAKQVDLMWAVLFSLATLAAAVLGPQMGNLADRRGSKFSLLRWVSFAAIGGTAAVALLPPRQMILTAGMFVVTHTCFLLAGVLYNSALADVSTKQNAAMVSSLAWGVGYVGGLLGLLIALATKGLAVEADRVRLIFRIAGAMFLLFALPLMLARLKGRPTEEAGSGEARSQSLVRLLQSFMREGSRFRLFWAFFLYMNGVNTVIIFTSWFAKQTLGYEMDELIWLFVKMNLVAAPSAIIFGKVAERFGQITVLKFVVAAWVAVVLVICVAGKEMFDVVACCAASLIGPVQALSRSLFRVIFPDDSMSAFFGVQSLATRGSALVGPLLFGVVSTLTGSQRLGALTAAALFAAGLAILFTVPKSAVKQIER